MNTIALLLVWTQVAGATPDLATARQWFEAGQHQQVVAIPLTEQSAPSLIYVVAQSQNRLDQRAAARATYEQLAARPTIDPWHFIGRSAVLLADTQPAQAVAAVEQTVATAEQAVAAAQQAVTLGPRVAETHFQLGLAQAERRDYAQAALAFEAAIAVDPMPAYAHYYAGLSYYQAQRVDLMAKFFEGFLKLAPEAPERPQVESIMRTVRGRR